MQNIKHVFFDLDHTLWDFNKNSELSFKQIFEEQKVTLDFNDFLSTYIPINERYWKLYREEKISKSDLRFNRLKDSFKALNYKTSKDFINKISEDYLRYLPNYNYLIKGAIDVLEYLKPKYTLHIITNGFEEVQNKKMEKSNIKNYFDVIVTSESVGLKKPNPKVFEFALKQANAKAEESIMIGDSYEADIMGAFNVGILPIHFDEQQKSVNNGIISVNSLADLQQYL